MVSGLGCFLRLDGPLPGGCDVRFPDVPDVVVRGLKLERGWPAGFPHMQEGLLPIRKRAIFHFPVNHESFIAPLSNPGHDCGMRTGVSECAHRFRVLPQAHCPEGAIAIRQQLSPDEARCSFKRSPDLSGFPVEVRNESKGTQTKPGDGNNRHDSSVANDAQHRSLLFF